MAGPAHASYVQRILRGQPGARSHGFHMALLNEVFEHEEQFREPRVVPDAYIVNVVRETLVVYEVENTSRLQPDKMDVYQDLWWALDNIGWHFVLIVIDLTKGDTISVFDVGDLALHAINAKASIRAKRAEQRMNGCAVVTQNVTQG